jgi:hypothetical protein
MVCYARPALRMAALLLVVLVVFGRPAGHFFASAALIVAVAVAAAGAAVAAVIAFTVFLSVRRRRAAAGGCVTCRFRCQHAMTEQSRLLVLRSAAVRDPDRVPDGPRWPDRPAYRSGVALQSAPRTSPGSTARLAGGTEHGERVGSAR